MKEGPLEVWHVYSDGTRADIPFLTDDDKTFAWNSVAIVGEIAGVRVTISTINDTHLHTMVLGNSLQAERFRTTLQQRLCRLYGPVFLSCRRVVKREDILSSWMYVYRNCLDFYHKLPGEYPWGSGNIFFSEKRRFFEGHRMGDLSLRGQFEMFRTKHPLPQEWRYDAFGRILPESFIDYEWVEQQFRTVRTFIAFQYVRKEDEAALKQEIYQAYLEDRRIQDLRRIGNRYCVNICGRMLCGASLDDRLKVAVRMLREGLSGRSASLAKALLLNLDDLRYLA